MDVTQYKQNIKKDAMKIVKVISKSLRQEWMGVDDDEREQIENEWANMLAKKLKTVNENSPYSD